MSRLITFKFPGLFNSEYPLTVIRLIKITEALHPKTAFDRVAAFRPQLFR